MFEILGYFKEYIIEGKYIGLVNYCEKDRETMGFQGRVEETLQTETLLTSGKKLKVGTIVTTMLYPICGKMIKKSQHA